MAVDIKLKRSSVPGKIPTTASLELGEIALNTYDGKAYMKKQVGNVQSIIEIGSGSGGGGGVTSVSVTSANGFAGTVANPTTTPAITILTSVVGIMKGNGSAASAAVAGTDYITPTQGTASWALNAVNAITASYFSGSIANAITASYALTATSASYASSSTSASYANTSVSASYANNATSASYANNATSASYAQNATTASYAQNTISASYASSSTSASYAVNATSASYANNATSASYALNATSASYAVSAAYAPPPVSVSYAETASYAGNFTVAGTITAQTLVVQVITSSQELITGSLIVSGSLNAYGGVTGSLLGTASWANNATSASYALTSTSASYASASTSASYAFNATSASYTLFATSASYASSSTSASYASSSTSASYASSSTSSSYAVFATSASYAFSSTSASYASASTSASYASSSTSASYALFADSASYASASTSASYANVAVSASYASSSTSASYALIATSASYASSSTSASYALVATSASYASASTSASYAVNASIAVSASYASSSTSASYAVNATSASYSNNSTSASYAANSTSASYANIATSASYSLNSTSASYAATSSYAIYAQTASYATNIYISGSIANVDYIDFDTTASFAAALGRLGYDSGEGTLQFGIAGGNVTLNIGEDLYQYVYNAETASMTKGQVVFISGSQGNRIAVKLASATNEYGSANTLGFVAETIAAGAEGWVMTEGNLRKLNTVGLIGGQLLYLSTTPGAYTQTPPIAPNHGVRLGYAERIDNNVGSIFVKIDNGYELGELHNVVDSSNTGSYGDLFIKSGSVWINSRQLTGSYGLTGSLTSTNGGFTGSLLGTASYALFAISASYASASTSASYASSSTSASYASSSTTASYALTSTSASYALFATSASYASASTNASYASASTSASYANNATSASFATQANNAFTASSADNFLVRGTLTAQTIVVQTITSSISVVTGSMTVSGSLTVLQGITGSLFGTASWANNATSASYALNTTSASYASTSTSASFASNAAQAQTASYVLNAVSASYANVATSASYASASTSASYASASTSASYALFATTASYALDSTTASYALTATSASYSNNSTSASYANNATSASYANTAGVALSGTGSFTGSFNGAHTGSLLGTASWANNATTASYSLTSTSASYALNATTASYALVATSASYSQNSTSASYALNSTSASYALTASYISGSVANINGTTNYVAKFTTANTVGNSQIFDNGSIVGIGATSAYIDSNDKFIVAGGRLAVNASAYSAGSFNRSDAGNIVDLLIGGYGKGTLNSDGTNFSVIAVSGDLILSSNSTEKVRILSGGNVGIGTTLPKARLHVLDSANFGTIAIGNYSYPTLLTSNASSGEFRIDNRSSFASGFISFYPNGQDAVSGSEAMRIATSGNVGIGTTAPVQKLDVRGNIYLPSANFITYNNGDVELGVSGSYNFVIRTYTGTVMTEKMRVTSDGNVGIGTTSPTTPLRVEGGTSMTGGWNKNTTLKATYPVLIFNSNDTKWGGIGYDYSAGMRFWISASSDDVSGTASPLFNLLHGGYVGIGTGESSYKLRVQGTTYFTGQVYTGDRINIGNTTDGVVGITYDSTAGYVYASSSRGLWLSTNSSLTNGIYINTNGSVGIGTTVPNAKLEVNGNIYTTSNTNFLLFGTNSGTNPYLQGEADNSLYIGNNNTSRIFVSGSGNVGISTITPTSRLEVKAPNTAATTNYASKNIIANSPLVGGYTGAPIVSMLAMYDGTIHGADIGYLYDTIGYGLVLSVNNDTTGDPIEALRINRLGNVGIGTTSPLAKLDIEGNLLIRNAQFEATSSATSGATTIATIATGSYRAAFVDYVAYSGSNQRAGTFISNWNGSNIQFTDYSTVDIGTTSAVTMSATISGGNALIRATTPASWTVTATYRTI